MGGILKNIKNIIFIIILSIFTGYFLLVAVDYIPGKYIEKNIKISAEQFQQQGNYPSMYQNGAYLENFSDADAFAVVYNKETNNPFIDAFKAYNYFIGDNGANRGVKALYQTVNNNNHNMKFYEHSQEWHGYQICLRPLLVFYNLNDIRYICFLFTTFLLIFFCIQYSKILKNPLGIIPFLISFEYFCFSLESMSILLCTDICTTLVGCLAILYVYQRKQNEQEFYKHIFIIIGILAAYFSMFNMPLITIGFPLLVWLSVTENQNNNIKTRIHSLFENFFYWLLGYGVMSLTKIFATKILFGARNGIYGLKWYTGLIHNISLDDRFEMVFNFLERINVNSQVKLHLFIYTLLLMIILILIKKKNLFFSLKKYIPYTIVALLPILWILIVPIHSLMDWTIFLFSISIFSILQIFWNIYNEK